MDIGVIGVPFDGGVTNRTGTRHGPRAVRDQSSLLRRLHPTTLLAPFEVARVRDLGDCWIESPFALEGALEEIAGFYSTIIAASVVPLSVGGDHAISLPILRAVRRSVRSGWCISMRIATPATTIWARASTTARRSAERRTRACSIRSG